MHYCYQKRNRLFVYLLTNVHLKYSLMSSFCQKIVKRFYFLKKVIRWKIVLGVSISGCFLSSEKCYFKQTCMFPPDFYCYLYLSLCQFMRYFSHRFRSDTVQYFLHFLTVSIGGISYSSEHDIDSKWPLLQ